MKFKRPIYRYLFYTAWLALVGGVILLLVSANGKAKTRTCKGVAISINNGGDKIFVEKEDVLKNMEKTAQGSLLKKHTGDINLSGLETSLENDPWIQDAELYFDTNDILHVAVSERAPVARVFTRAGTSFYIDSTGFQLPLLESYSARLPVITGFTAAKKLTAADSVLLEQTKEVVQTITADSFWNAQVGQIDITPQKTFELIPVVGSHVIRLGSGYGTESKLRKLMVFYRQVLPKAGLTKYSALDVQFDGQVVALKRGPVSKVDSIQLQKNIEALMEKKLAEQEPEQLQPTTVPVNTVSNGDFEVEPVIKDTFAAMPAKAAKLTAPEPAPAKTTEPERTAAYVQQNSSKKTTERVAKPLVKPAADKKPAAPKPKAVMQPKVENDY